MAPRTPPPPGMIATGAEVIPETPPPSGMMASGVTGPVAAKAALEKAAAKALLESLVREQERQDREQELQHLEGPPKGPPKFSPKFLAPTPKVRSAAPKPSAPKPSRKANVPKPSKKAGTPEPEPVAAPAPEPEPVQPKRRLPPPRAVASTGATAKPASTLQSPPPPPAPIYPPPRVEPMMVHPMQPRMPMPVVMHPGVPQHVVMQPGDAQFEGESRLACVEEKDEEELIPDPGSADAGGVVEQEGQEEQDLRVCLIQHELSGYLVGIPYATGEEPSDLVERGNGEQSAQEEDEEMDYSPDMEDLFPETPPEGPPVGENQAPPEFDVEMQPNEDDDPMDVAISWLQDHALYALCSKPEVLVASKSSEGSEAPRTKPLEFTLKFGGSKVKVQVPSGALDEYTGELLDEKKLGEGMKLEMEELDHFQVCQVVSEKEAVRLVREAKRRVLSTRWVLHYKVVAGDISVAFMQARGKGALPVEEGNVTADSTVYRKVIREKGVDAIVLVLAYVDDILVFSTVATVAEKVFADLSKVFKMKRTGTLEPKTKSVISFLGRNIYQKSDGSLFFGLKPGMLKACAEEYNVSRAAKLPKLERLWTSLEGKAVAISHEAYQRYRRVLGKLSWMALTRPDLQFAVGFLARSQANPDSRSEDCMRAVLRFVLSLGDRVQKIPAIWVDYVAASNLQTIDCFCDASWNLPSVSGGIISWQMNLIKSFSRKQSVVALSSAEAELSALVETVKEGLFVGLLQQSFVEGLPSDDEGSYKIRIYTDSEAAKAIASMEGLLRRVRHLELRCAYLQQKVQSGRVILEFISGAYNASDGLTKSMVFQEQLDNLYEVTGLVPFEEELGEFELDRLEVEELPSPFFVPLEYVSLCERVAQNCVELVVVELFCQEESLLPRFDTLYHWVTGCRLRHRGRRKYSQKKWLEKVSQAMFSVALAAKVVYVRDVGRGNLGLRPPHPEEGGLPVLVFIDVNGWQAYEEGQYPKWPNQAQLSGFWKTIAAHNTEMKNELKGLVEQYHTSLEKVTFALKVYAKSRLPEADYTALLRTLVKAQVLALSPEGVLGQPLLPEGYVHDLVPGKTWLIMPFP
ncbi:Retrovirus-related Pol polyprotein from transposon TNT 1-94 [Symbiodinium microadriaticum]|uniref:Retrovirus-related Pol polyprotein from transposon TNT 1-94 n=1 Tax=Symbiodinium microadriaticum TaxID=2951 RepID=A0A1Q9E9T5_SYMMI|nr:Retrovirus-related Pol polyprotein from transposon TNT 1-94 [Symbiodinium microadriaticum]